MGVNEVKEALKKYKSHRRVLRLDSKYFLFVHLVTDAALRSSTDSHVSGRGMVRFDS